MKIRTFETVKKGNDYIADVMSEFPQFAKLDECLQAAMKRTVTPDDLSRCAVKMAGYLVSISDLINTLVAEANEAYTYRKYKYLWEFSQLSKAMSKTDREQAATENSFEEYEQELIRRYVADFFKAKYDAYEKFVSVLQSKIGLEKTMMHKLQQ